MNELAVVRAAIAYTFQEHSMKSAAALHGISSDALKRWLVNAEVRVRSSAEQRRCDKRHGRYDHSAALRRAWSRGQYDTAPYHATRKTGDWGFRRDGEHNPFFGRKHSASTRSQLGEQARLRCIPSKGTYGEDWTPELRARIVQRDGGRCCVCGSTRELQVHHVDLDRGNSAPSNLLTLCSACHLGYHGRGEQADEIACAHAATLEVTC